MKYLLTLLIMVCMIGTASAGTANVAQVGDTIYVWGAGDANLTYIENQVSNSSALSHTGTVFIAGANINVNGTSTTLYINDSDCTWLKLNCTDGDVSDFRVDGYFEMNNSKITSWNTTSSAVVGQTKTTMHVPRPAIRFGDGSNIVHVNISNSNISHCGYNASSDTYGVYFKYWKDGRIENTTLSYLYSSHMTYYSIGNVFNYTKIHNNSFCAIEITDYCHNTEFLNCEIYYNGFIATLWGGYGGGGIRNYGQMSENMIFDNVSVHDGYSCLMFFGSGNGVIVKNSLVYNTSTRGIEFNTAHGGIVENTTVYGVSGGRGIYDVYGASQIFRNNTIHDCLTGIKLYSVYDLIGNVHHNTFYDNTYHIYFRNEQTHNSTIENNTISGPATYDIFSYLGADNNTVQDLDNYDNDLQIYLEGSASLFINYTNNKIMSNASSAQNPIITNNYHLDHSSLFMKRTAANAGITVYLYNGTLTPGSTNVTISSVNEWNETAGYESYNITVNSSNTTEICTFTTNVANATDWYGCYIDGVHIQDKRAVDGGFSWNYSGGFSTIHDLEIRWTSDWAPDNTSIYMNPANPIGITTKPDGINIFSREIDITDTEVTSFKLVVKTT